MTLMPTEGTSGCGDCSVTTSNRPPTALTIGGASAPIALIGNPNTGKTTLFNALTGYRRHVANYAGVTVETARGPLLGGPRQIELLDLPGTYSLSPISPDEALVRDILTDPKAELHPAGVLVIVDATHLRRNLYLVGQLLELNRPVVIAVNMTDVARTQGLEIDCRLLSERLGAAVIPIVATRQATLAPLRDALQALVDEPRPPTPSVALPAVGDRTPDDVQARYGWVDAILVDVLRRVSPARVGWSERLDRVLTHRVGGLAILLAVLFLVFQALFSWAGPMMDVIELGVGWLSATTESALPAGLVRDFVVNGLIGGVGSVIVFLPQIALLFLFIAILEDSGYLARAAFMLDRVMRAFGLTGRAFIPLLSAHACAIPAIMGTRTIADRRERLVTILIAPFMSCSARLPVYTLFIAAFIPALSLGVIGLQGLVMFAMYLVGVAVALPIAWLLRRSAFAGAAPPLILELPTYQWPKLRTIWQRVSLACLSFLRRAGTIIVVMNAIIWALGTYPRSPAAEAAVLQQASTEGWPAERVEATLAFARLEASCLGRLGHGIEPVVQHLGWDWRLGVAVLSSFPAREVVISTLGILYRLGSDVNESSAGWDDVLHGARHADGRPVFTIPVALSIMVFFALCAQCSSTLVTIGNETRSWRWPLISFFGMTALATLAAWVVYQVGSRVL